MIPSLISLRWQLQDRGQRLRRAFAYATGRLSEDAAQEIILDCRDTAGWYPLLTIAPADVLDTAIGRYGDPALALKPYLPAACEYVARKWDAGDDCWNAHDWALDTAREFAAHDGIDLDKAKDDPAPNPEGEQDHA